MMWPYLAFVMSAAALALIVWLWRRLLRLQWDSAQLQTDLAGLRSHQEQANHYARAQQEALLNSMVEGILVLDERQCVRLVNRTLMQWFNLEADVKGRSTLEVLRRHELQEMVSRAAEQEAAQEIELEVSGATPRILQVHACMVRGVQGENQGTVVVFHDVTRLKQLEDLRREFVANVSHELRTPLSLIAGSVETLIDGAKKDPEAADRFLHMIQKHTARLTFLIDDLLTLSQLESGRSVFHFQKVVLREAIERLLDDMRSRADAGEVAFRNQVPEVLSARADSQRLGQVLLNLLDNAIKYGKSNGTIEVGARAASADMIELWVRDNGPGIPAQAAERIFERFYRLDRARSRETGGTGLGLSIVKHIVQSHGGRVWVSSEPGKGATFFFTLPVAKS
jgi:two-component system, OmpR family, phosphate regulon sensor histidine kinase PhoR